MAERNWSVTAQGLTVERLAPATVATLRLRSFDATVVNAVSGALGEALPTRPTEASGRNPRLLCLAPGEWMIIGYSADTEAVLAAAGGASVAHLADVGEGLAHYAISGAAARDLLAKGCTLDFHSRIFISDKCAQTLFAQVPVVIDHPTDGDDFILHAPASYTHHLEAWLSDAAIEFRAEVSA